jgi:hypothetical protein
MQPPCLSPEVLDPRAGRSRPFGAGEQKRRSGVAFGLAACGVIVAAWGPCAAAATGEARDDMDQARAALGARPPARDAARTLLGRAVATAEDPVLRSEALFRLATLDEEDGDYERALDRDRASVAAAPASRWARSASARVSWLEERSEEHFVPFSRLMRAWRDPSLTVDASALEAFAQEVDRFPAGTVRGEARMFVAETWLTHFRRPDRAEAELRQVIADPAANAQSRRFAVRDLAGTLLEQDRLDEAAGAARAHPSDVEPSFLARLGRLLRRRSLARAADGVLAVGAAAIVGAWIAAHCVRPSPNREARLRRFANAILWVAATVAALALAFLLVVSLRPSWLERIGL